MQQGLSNLKQMAKEAGAEDIKIDSESGSISFVMPSQTVNDVLGQFEKTMKNDGLKIKITRTKVDNYQDEHIEGTDKMKSCDLKPTEPGYVNRNNQRNNGRSDERGSDNKQWFYFMECLNCGEKYKANGSDIFQRKCPACQGGKP